MRRPILLVAAAIVALLSASGIAVAVNYWTSDGGAIQRVSVASSTDKFTTTSESFVDIPGAARIVREVDGSDLLLARYSAESWCLGGEQKCSVRIVAVQENGTILQMHPASGADFAFHYASPTSNEPESHSMDRWLKSYFHGNVTVKAQAAALNGSRFTLDDWSLTVERAD